MAQAVPRPALRGPTLIRLLARLADLDVAASGASLPERLGQWLDWKQALALADALDQRPPPPQPANASPQPLQAECARARQMLVQAINEDPLRDVARADDTPDYLAVRQCYLAHQRAMQASAGRLRGRLRDALAQLDADRARLAELDAVMEAALTPREHALLAKVPALLAPRFERLRATHAAPGWLDGFRRELRGLLLAELAVRFQPIDALLAALPTP